MSETEKYSSVENLDSSEKSILDRVEDPYRLTKAAGIVFEGIGFDPLSENKNSVVINLGCGTRQEGQGEDYTPEQSENIGEVIGANRSIGIDLAKNENPNNYTHVTMSIDADTNGADILESINNQTGSDIQKGDVALLIANSLADSPSSPISMKDMAKAVYNQSLDLLMDGGVLQYDMDHYVKTTEKGISKLVYVGTGPASLIKRNFEGNLNGSIKEDFNDPLRRQMKRY